MLGLRLLLFLWFWVCAAAKFKMCEDQKSFRRCELLLNISFTFLRFVKRTSLKRTGGFSQLFRWLSAAAKLNQPCMKWVLLSVNIIKTTVKNPKVWPKCKFFSKFDRWSSSGMCNREAAVTFLYTHWYLSIYKCLINLSPPYFGLLLQLSLTPYNKRSAQFIINA